MRSCPPSHCKGAKRANVALAQQKFRNPLKRRHSARRENPCEPVLKRTDIGGGEVYGRIAAINPRLRFHERRVDRIQDSTLLVTDSAVSSSVCRTVFQMVLNLAN